MRFSSARYAMQSRSTASIATALCPCLSRCASCPLSPCILSSHSSSLPCRDYRYAAHAPQLHSHTGEVKARQICTLLPPSPVESRQPAQLPRVWINRGKCVSRGYTQTRTTVVPRYKQHEKIFSPLSTPYPHSPLLPHRSPRIHCDHSSPLLTTASAPAPQCRRAATATAQMRRRHRAHRAC